MSNKKFSAKNVRLLKANPNVASCTPGRISFTEEFATKVCDALKRGDDPYQVFEDNGLSLKVLGKSRVVGIVSLWRSRYELQDLPRRRNEVKVEKPKVETAAERKERRGNEGIAMCEELIANRSLLGLDDSVNPQFVVYEAVKKVNSENPDIILRILCEHYHISMSNYYDYFRKQNPEEETFVSLLKRRRK